MLTILSYINLLMQPLASTIAAVVWFGLLLGQPQVARRTIGQLLCWLVIVTAISRWLVPTAYQVSVTSTLLIVSLVYVGRRIQQATPLGVLLLDAIVSSLLAAWVYNVALAILSLLTLPLVIQLLGLFNGWGCDDCGRDCTIFISFQMVNHQLFSTPSPATRRFFNDWVWHAWFKRLFSLFVASYSVPRISDVGNIIAGGGAADYRAARIATSI